LLNKTGRSKTETLNEFDRYVEEICLKSRLGEAKEYIQHGTTTLFEHSISVAYYSMKLALALKLPVNYQALIRGALLHDYFLYDWHIKDPARPLHGLHHPEAALRNAETEFELSEIERNIILRHMFPLTLIPPVYAESILVCVVDKFCSVCEIVSRRPDTGNKCNKLNK